MPNLQNRPRTRILVLLAAVAVVAVTAIVTDAGAAPRAWKASPATVPVPGPDDDSFYVPPDPLPAGCPGDIVRWRPAVAGTPEVNASVWQVMYLSTDALGHPDAVTGTVLVPKGVDLSGAPIVGFAPGTEGPAFRRATSKMIQIGWALNSPVAVGITDAALLVLPLVQSSTACHTAIPADLCLTSGAGFQPAGPVAMAGTFSLPAFSGCGMADGLLGSWFSGGVDTVSEELNPR